MRRSFSLFLLFVPVVCGCGGTAEPDVSSAQQFESPQEAYAAFVKAGKANDWAAMASMLSDESRKSFVGGMIFHAGFSTMQDEAKEKELKELLARHGVDLDAEPAPPADGEPSGPDAMMAAFAEPIKDIPAFVSELGAWIKKNDDGSQNPFAELGELGEVKMDGDKAHAIVQTDMGPQPFEFHKEGDGWVVHLSSDPPEGGLAMPEDDAPVFGSISFADQLIPLRHSLAYKWKHFDDPSTVVVLKADPFYDREMNELKEMLAGELGEGHFFSSGPRVELSLDEEGNLLSLFAWVDNVSINSNSGVEIDATIEGDRVVGTAMMTEPDEIDGKEFSFDANFDAPMITAE